jgi:uncharacterized membrane protein
MKRYKEIDILKGVAVICMVIFHIFYYPHQYGFTEITYDSFPLPLIAKIAQIIFITSVGINLVFAYSQKQDETKKEYYKKQLKRILKLVICAIIMSLFTYYVFGNNFVKFGILHFIAFSSLVLLPVVGDVNIIRGLIAILLVLYFANYYHPQLFSSVPSPIAFISGFYSRWGAVDHFPLLPWLIFMCIGVLIGHEYVNNKPDLLPEQVEESFPVKVLGKIGSYSLEVYMVHWVILFVVYTYIYPKFIRNSSF